eukprot:6818309-Alexandrium_andersonii.AAC.1
MLNGSRQAASPRARAERARSSGESVRMTKSHRAAEVAPPGALSADTVRARTVEPRVSTAGREPSGR